jgi:hypothetical protein
MEKPKLKQRSSILDYHEVIHFIEKKYNIDTRDYASLFGHGGKKEGHFEVYQRVTGDKMPCGYPDVSGKYIPDWQEPGYEGWTIIRNGEKIKATKEEYDADFKLIHDHYKRYQEWVKTNPEPPYLDYWHWLLDRCFCEIHNGSTAYWNVMDIIKDKKTPDWVKEITQKVADEFGEYFDKDGCVEVLIEW